MRGTLSEMPRRRLRDAEALLRLPLAEWNDRELWNALYDEEWIHLAREIRATARSRNLL